MGMANRDCQRVGCVVGVELGARQKNPDHRPYLRLFGVAGADDCLLHGIRSVFRHRETRLRRNQKRDAPGLAELQCGRRVLVDERLFHRRFIRLEGPDNFREPVVKGDQTMGEFAVERRANGAGRNESQRISSDGHHAPTSAAEAGIDPQNANRRAHVTKAIAPFPAGCHSAMIEERRGRY